MGDRLSEVPASDRWSPRASGKTDGTCGTPRHRRTELVLWAPMDAAALQGCVGTVILSRCTTGSHWTFIFALNAKSHWGRYPLPRIDQGKFFEGGLKGRAWGGPAGQVMLPCPPHGDKADALGAKVLAGGKPGCCVGLSPCVSCDIGGLSVSLCTGGPSSAAGCMGAPMLPH